MRSVGNAFHVQVVHALNYSLIYEVASSGQLTVPGGGKPFVSCASMYSKVVEYSSRVIIPSMSIKVVSSIGEFASIISVAHLVGDERTGAGPGSVTVIESGVAIEGGIVDDATASSLKLHDDSQGMHRPLVL